MINTKQVNYETRIREFIMGRLVTCNRKTWKRRAGEDFMRHENRSPTDASCLHDRETEAHGGNYRIDLRASRCGVLMINI